MTDLPHIHPISARAVTPMSKDEWEEQYQLGAFLAGPFDERDPQLPKRVAADYGEPATPSLIADWLHDHAVKCCDCNRYWLDDEPDAPGFEMADGFACEECADDAEAVDPRREYGTYSTFKGSVW